MKLNDPKKLWSRAIYHWPKLDQIPWVCPRGLAKSFPIVNNLLSPQGKKGNTKTGPCPLGFNSDPRGSAHGKETIHLMPDIFSEKSILWFVTRNKQYRLLLCVTAYYGLLLSCCSLLCVTACYWLLPFLTVSLACTTDDIGVKGISFWRNYDAASVGEWYTKKWFIILCFFLSKWIDELRVV